MPHLLSILPFISTTTSVVFRRVAATASMSLYLVGNLRPEPSLLFYQRRRKKNLKLQGRLIIMLQKCGLLMLTTLLLALTVQASRIVYGEESEVKSAVYFSPKFELGPGEVTNKIYANIDFPRGHIGIKDFKAELIDEMGISVPLHEGYLHHWITNRYYALVDPNGNQRNKIIALSNAGTCEHSLWHFFGFGSETRRSDYNIPDPYAVEVGNPADIPRGYEERWYFNLHIIDTRGAVDKLGCTECRCELYNVTKDAHGKPLPAGYKGGSPCCYDQTKCRVKRGFQGIKRGYHLKYTIKWVDWDDSVVPAKVYIFDVTDTGERKHMTESDLLRQHTENTWSPEYGCKVEYDVEPCNVSGISPKECLDNKRAPVVVPATGHIVYGVGHQHNGAAGGAIYREDGRRICSSLPIYGEGDEAGNEAGYLVGMTTCYPEPGSAKITAGETLIIESNYSNNELHTGVMGFFYILLADLPADDI